MTGEFLFRIFLPHVSDYTKRFSQVKANISAAESFQSESSQPPILSNTLTGTFF